MISVEYLFAAIFADPTNPSRGIFNPAMKERGSPHPAMGGGQGRKTPPLPVRTIDKEWKASVRRCSLFKQIAI